MPPEAETTTSTTTTPPASGGVTPESTTQEAKPYFVAETQADFEARFGPEKTGAKKAMAKSYGFESIEAMDAAMKARQAQIDADKTELQRAKDEASTLTTAQKASATELNALKLERAAEKKALALGTDPSKLEAVLRLRDVKDTDLAEDGKPNDGQIASSIEAVLAEHPYFKAGGATVGAEGGVPASAAATNPTADQETATAMQAGNIREAIAAQTRKLFKASQGA